MNEYKYIIIILFLAVLISCKENTNDTLNKNFNIQNRTQLSSINGYWIMSDYIDSILQNKTIEEQTMKRLTSTAIILHLDNETLTYYGLILGNEKIKLNKKYDSLTILKGMGEYQLSYDSTNDLIKAKSTQDYYDSKDSMNYVFRRVNKNEQRLIDGIDNKPFFKKLKSNFYSMFIDSLIYGEYKLVKNNSVIMKLDKNGTLSGFKNYNRYFIHDYFGTLHPYRPEDAIIFKDTTMISNGNVPPESIGIYSWEFMRDTLILTEMQTENYDTYYKGTVRYEFIKKDTNKSYPQ